MSRFLFATVPIPAHSRNPLRIADRLVQRGHEVLWFAGHRFHERIAATGATPLPYGATRDYDGAHLLEHFPELARLRGPRAIGWAYAELFVGEAQHRVADLEPVLAGQRIDAVLSDALSYGVVSLAESRGVPAATFGDGPLVRSHGDTPAFGPGMLPMRGPLSRLRNHAVREASRRWVFAQAQERHDRLRAAMGLPPDGLDVLQAAVSPMLHLQGCTPSFEYPVPGLPPTVHWVGALRPEPPKLWKPPAWWEEVCTSTRPVVHVTQGSLRPDMRELVVPALRALERDDVLVVVTTGGPTQSALEGLFGGPLPPNVRVSEYVPYDLLLPHVDVCVTNGGYTGVTTALHHGVPLVQAGSTEEKAEIGARVRWSGVGVRIRSTRPGSRRVRAAVRTVLRTSRYRRAAQRVGAEMRRHDAAEECAHLLETLAATGAPVTQPMTPLGAP